ncbi:type I Iterative Polyketide synthase (PKS) [Aspergillus brasiliensis]|uniref:Type I Iterative Polyketide synthase (PKS) n=1 Tax=Aspergillus brasiliensis TaxID=319629 RepID=A0A9W6DQX3_9EURO|nr:type I Iterative Polyketide synthase (PKS) [Aspergillus brasiliensis]GKZ49683.1 type I Iterative Polyketide synthase (PKS) [Aspergillus brasiliensis]
MAPPRLLCFGDQTTDSCSRIKELYAKATQYYRLRDFLTAVDRLVRSQTFSVSVTESTDFHDHHSIETMAEAYAQHKEYDVILSTVLLCVAQLGGLILHLEKDPNLLCAQTSKLHIVGLCTGLFPAALAATVSSPAELLPLSLLMVMISLRLAVQVDRRSRSIEASRQSWAVSVKQASAGELERVITSFNEEHELPKHKQAYISAELDTSVTISGPPSTLSLLMRHPSIINLPKSELPIAAAYHAPHLSRPSLDDILGPLKVPDLRVRRNVTVVSPNSGMPYATASLRGLLHLMIADLLQNKISWDRMMRGLPPGLRTSNATVTVAPSERLGSLVDCSFLSGYLDTDYKAVAIVGMSCRLPGVNSPEDLWNLLESGQRVRKGGPGSSFDIQTNANRSGDDKNNNRAVRDCFLDQPGLFDTSLFNISPDEARNIDPVQRLLLLATYEALERAGYSPHSHDCRRVGTFIGQTASEPHYVHGASAAELLNQYFKWEGPVLTIDTTCSSSTAPIEMAYHALRRGECDIAVVGGGNLLSDRTRNSTEDGHFCSEGVGVIVLKRLPDARRNNDCIWGTITAVASTHTAHLRHIPHVDAFTQKRLMKDVLRQARLNPKDLGYIEVNGADVGKNTAQVESSLSLEHCTPDGSEPLRIGSVKMNVGNVGAASGITSVIKSVLMLERGVIPPCVGVKAALNPQSPSPSGSRVDSHQSSVPFRQSHEGTNTRRIMVNDSNATGGKSALIIESNPHILARDVPDPRTTHVVTVSGQTVKSLRGNQERLLQYLQEQPEAQLADVAYTTTARRVHHACRRAYSVSSVQQLRGLLQKELAHPLPLDLVHDKPSRVFVFTGQESQHPAMGRQLFRTCLSFKQRLLECNTICIQLGYGPCLNLIERDDVELGDMTPIQSQLALVSLELALAGVWQAWGIVPEMVMGHGLGEYAALCVAGVLSLYDTLYLVGARAQLIHRDCTPDTHGMLVIESEVRAVREALLQYEEFASCTISCLNGPSSTVVSGERDQLCLLKNHLAGTPARMLPVPFAFHSPQMDSFLDEYRQLCSSIQFNEPGIPVVSTLTGRRIEGAGIFGPDYLARQIREPVCFQQALRTCEERLTDNGKGVWLEVGPAPVCTDVALPQLSVPGQHMLFSLSPKRSDWETISQALTQLYTMGCDINWRAFHADYIDHLQLLELPTYSFDLEDYGIPCQKNLALMTGGRPLAISREPPFSTSTLHKIETEVHGDRKSAVTFSSDLSEPTLLAAIRGHSMLNQGLCPSSVYTDMALTAASYTFKAMDAVSAVPPMNVSNMEIIHPLVVQPEQPNHILKLRAKRSKGSNCVEVVFSTQDPSSPEEQQRARCTVYFDTNGSTKQDASERSHHTQTKCNTLRQAAISGSAHYLRHSMIYKLFSHLIAYSPRYRCIQDITMHDESNEATATIKFPNPVDGETFAVSPYWVESLIQLGSFALNGHSNAPEDTAYICTGWWKLWAPADLSPDQEYTSYVNMHETETESGLYIGEVYLLSDGQIVGGCTGLRFQQLPRPELRDLLTTGGSRGIEAKAPSPATDAESRSTKPQTVKGKAVRFLRLL